MSFVFVIGLTDFWAVLAGYTLVVLASLQDQCIGANSQSELVILKLVIELVTTVHGPSCTFQELIFPCHQPISLQSCCFLIFTEFELVSKSLLINCFL